MSRFENMTGQRHQGDISYDELYQREMQLRLANGEVVEMFLESPVMDTRTGRQIGVEYVKKYVDNNEKAIAQKIKQGLLEAELSEETVQVASVKPRTASAKPEPAPKKAASKKSKAKE